MTWNTIGIGELSRATGVPVRTIRFYCDEGILGSTRSAGGHRRFDRCAVDRLGLIRNLRGLGLGLRSITAVLNGERSVAEVVAADRKALDVELAALAWRRASLRAVEEASPVDRAARLELLAAVQNGTVAHKTLVSFWRRYLAGPLPSDTSDMFLAVSAPTLPAAPTPEQVVAYAEMVVLLEGPDLKRQMLAHTRLNLPQIFDQATLNAGIGEACEIAHPLILAGQPPTPGPAVDRLVDVQADARGARDSPRFRRDLLEVSAFDRSPSLRRYWRLVATVTGAAVSVGETYTWLLDALERSLIDTNVAT